MSNASARPHYQRARRDAEKAERRISILSAAAVVLRSTSFEGFSMSLLAKEAGIAKATLYLYFQTREEVLLAMHVEALAEWSRSLVAGLHDGMSDDAFVALFEATSKADLNLMTLRARLESVIEHNVSIERFIEAKRAMRELIEDLSPRIERTLGLVVPGTGARLLVSLDALLLGAEQAFTGPAIAGLDLPPDVVDFMRLHTEIDLFRSTAPLIVAGIRRNTQLR